MFINVFPKIMSFMRRCEKCGKARQATEDNIVHCKRNKFLCRIYLAGIQIYAEYLIIIVFPRQQWLCESAALLRCPCLVEVNGVFFHNY
jgi:hypothetical protein